MRAGVDREAELVIEFQAVGITFHFNTPVLLTMTDKENVTFIKQYSR